MWGGRRGELFLEVCLFVYVVLVAAVPTVWELDNQERLLGWTGAVAALLLALWAACWVVLIWFGRGEHRSQGGDGGSATTSAAVVSANATSAARGRS